MALTQDDLIAYLNETLEPDEALGPDTALFTSGLLDSVLMQDLIMYFEEKTGTQVAPGDVTLENFDTPASIIKFAESV